MLGGENQKMKLFRFRQPSLNTMLGITRTKKAINRSLGLNIVKRYAIPSRTKQYELQKVGYYSPEMRVIRNTAKGNFPTPLGIKVK